MHDNHVFTSYLQINTLFSWQESGKSERRFKFATHIPSKMEQVLWRDLDQTLRD